MAHKIKLYLVRMDHVEGCARNKGCGPECVRIYDGWVGAYALHLPNSDSVVRIREKIPDDWCTSKTRREQYYEQRKVYLLQQYLEQGRRRSRMTGNELAAAWLAQREAEGYVDVAKDRQRIEGHVLPVLGKLVVCETRPRHAVELVNKLKITPSVQGGNLASRTIRSIYFTAKQMYEWAVLQEIVISNPIKVGPRVLPPKADKNPAWRKGAVFTQDEMEQLISSPLIPLHRRVYYALGFLTGQRPGQVSALRWGDYEPAHEPLGRLASSESWDSKRKRVKSTKTGAEHLVPVHPVLAKLLATWKLTGWKERHGASPKQYDLIVPNIDHNPRDNRKVYEDFLEDLDRLGLRHRRVYDARRTFISLGMSGGASKDLLMRITHPKSTDVFDLYVTPTWASLCEQVLTIKVQLRGEEGNVVPLRFDQGR